MSRQAPGEQAEVTLYEIIHATKKKFYRAREDEDSDYSESDKSKVYQFRPLNRKSKHDIEFKFVARKKKYGTMYRGTGDDERIIVMQCHPRD